MSAGAPTPARAWHVQRPQARRGERGSGWQQHERPSVPHSPPGTRSSLSGEPQKATTWHSLQRARGQKAGNRRCQSLIALTATVPSSSWLQAACQHHALFLITSLAEPQEQYKRSQQMNSSQPGGAGPPYWVNPALAERSMGPALLFYSSLTEQERQKVLEKPWTLCLVICDHENGMTHFAQDIQLYCQVCGRPDGCSPPSARLPVGQKHPFSVIQVTLPAAWASWAKWENSCSIQLY